MKCVVLLSGGLDSTTVLWLAKRDGREIIALSFNYCQKHCKELEYSKYQAIRAGCSKHLTINTDFSVLGGSSLTSNIEVIKRRTYSDIPEGVPNTYVPARNTIFISYAMAVAEVESASEIHIGVNSIDYSGYPDCRPQYIDCFQKLIDLSRPDPEGQKLQLRTPLLHMTKSEIILLAQELGVDFSMTSSCYSPSDNGACGHCDSCLIRSKGFIDSGIKDTTKYSRG